MPDIDALAGVEWEACALEPKPAPEMERWARQLLGHDFLAVRYLSACPWVARTAVLLDESLVPLLHVDVRRYRYVSLVVSQDNSCRFCYAASRGLLKILAVPEVEIQALEQDLLTRDDAALNQELAFVRRVSRADPIPAAEFRALIASGYSVDYACELAFVAAAMTFLNRIATLPALPLEPIEEVVNGWAVRLFRPIIAWRLRKVVAPRTTDQPAYEPNRPYAYLVAALGHLPLKGTLAAMLRGAWDSQALPVRAKALVFAVVARGLACPISESEATRLLLAEGLTTEAVAGLLANLSSPELSPLENALVRFARETIWYRPAQVQRSARALRAELSDEQFVELIGVASLANALCRLSVVLAAE